MQKRSGRGREQNHRCFLQDEKILAEGKCDYLGFSYYMTNAVKADAKKDTTESLDGSSPNPYETRM